jgi:hypothetical protein
LDVATLDGAIEQAENYDHTVQLVRTRKANVISRGKVGSEFQAQQMARLAQWARLAQMARLAQWARQQAPLAQQQVPLAQQQVPLARQQVPLAQQQVPLAQQQVPLAQQQVPLPVLELSVPVLSVLELSVLSQVIPQMESPEALKFRPSRHRCSCCWSQKCRLECPKHPLCTSVQPAPKRKSTAIPRPP